MGLLWNYHNLKTRCLLPLFRLSDQLCCTRWNVFTQEVDKSVFLVQAGTGVRALCTWMLSLCVGQQGVESQQCGGFQQPGPPWRNKIYHLLTARKIWSAEKAIKFRAATCSLQNMLPVEFPSAKEKRVSCDQSIISPKLLIFHWFPRYSI